MPAADAFADLLAELGSEVDAIAKELEVYATDAPPPGYSLDLEVAGVLAAADDQGWDRFHLVGYSGGGSVALALAAAHGVRLSSLALLEPAWAGSWDDASEAHRALWPEYARLAALPPDEAMPAFVRLQLREGVLVVEGGARVHDDGQQPAEQQRRDRERHHELDQGHAARAARGGAVRSGTHGSTFRM